MNRESHIAELNKVILAHGFKPNSYGIYHRDNYSIDTRKNNIKISRDGIKIVSKPLVQIDCAKLERWFIIHSL